MARRSPKRSGLVAVLGLGVLLALGSARSVRAQGFTPDPFNGVGEYNIGYRDYLTATYPSGYIVAPNQGVLTGSSGVSRYNQYQRYLEDLEGLDRFPAENDLPSYNATRRNDPRSNAMSMSNNPYDSGDRVYLRDRKARDQKYLDYLRETDPKKRAKLYREYTQDNLRTARDLAQPRWSSLRTPQGATVTPSPSRPVTPSPSAIAPTTPRPMASTPGSFANNPSRSRRVPASPLNSRRSISSVPRPPATPAPRAGIAPSSPSRPRSLAPSNLTPPSR